MEKTCAVILAAGDGTRMKSTHPKVLCEVLFKPMLSWVIECCRHSGIVEGAVILGAGAEEVQPLLPERYLSVLQPERRGTGHAASMAQDFLREGGFSHVAVLCGDAPLLSWEDFTAARERHLREENLVTVISAQVGDPTGYGRILRDGGTVAAIVEEKDADQDQKMIGEINAGAYWLRTDFLLDFFAHMDCNNSQGEYYLTDCIAFARESGGRAGAHIAASPHAALGANSRAQLAELNEIARHQVLERLMDAGVSIPFADGVVIGPDVSVAPDTTILPNTVIRGHTTIGADCEIGPGSVINDCSIGDRCRILSSYMEASTIESDVRIGPMSNVRPGCQIGNGVKVGDFVELKNSVIGQNTSVAHLTYVGDSDIGSGCNFGCGVVTVNYDGNKKFRTTVGKDTFVGCNVNLVAPVQVGNRVYAAAGTTITDDVPDDALVIGRARQVVKEHWVQERGRYNRYKKKRS